MARKVEGRGFSVASKSAAFLSCLSGSELQLMFAALRG